MPKTTVQKVIFGLLMSFFMVLAMEMYNTGLRNGGLTNAGILNALRELPLMFALCFLTSTVVGEPLAARLAARMAVPREWPFAAVLARSAMTVCVMCPAMSLWATVIFQQPEQPPHQRTAEKDLPEKRHGKIADHRLEPGGHQLDPRLLEDHRSP